MKRADFHLHTGAVSCCAKEDATVQNYIDTSAKEGVTAIGIADHLWDKKVAPTKFYPINGFEELLNVVPTIPKDTKGIKVFLGCETDMNVYGEIGIHPESASLLDYVLVAMSHYRPFDNVFLGMDANDPKFMRKFAIDRFMRACNAEYSVPVGIPHPFVPHGVKCPERLMQEISDNDYLDCFKEARRKGVFLEVHCSCLDNDWENYKDGYPVEMIRMMMLARECGCRFTYGSDAHWMSMYDGTHEPMEKFAR